MNKQERVQFPKHGIKVNGMVPKEGLRWYIDPEEQQVRDNRGGPRMNPPRRKSKPSGEQTSWLK